MQKNKANEIWLLVKTILNQKCSMPLKNQSIFKQGRGEEEEKKNRQIHLEALLDSPLFRKGISNVFNDSCQ